MESRMTASAAAQEHRFSAYQFFILSVCLCALLAVAAEFFISLSPETRTILHYGDTVACGIFLVDFFMTLRRAPDKLRYLATWGWVDLLSSVPAIGPLRVGVLGRVVRLLRVMRAIKSLRTIAVFVKSQRAQSAFLAALLVSLFLLTAASIAILKVETVPASNIKTAQDAMWWAISTIATVGSSDVYPVTPGGRLIGALVMVTGIGIFGIVSGVAAAWFLTPLEEQEDADIVELKQMIGGLQTQLSELRK
jgi:voltage-gated potassium channel